MPNLICPVCSQPVDPSASAVCGYRRAGRWHDWWVPFVEDLRTDPSRVVHPECFVADSGLDALLAVIHESDEGQRRHGGAMQARIMSLERLIANGTQRE